MSLFIGFGLLMIGLVWMTSGVLGVLLQRRVAFVPIVGLVGLLLVTLRCILAEVDYGFVVVVLVARLLVAPVLVGYTGSVGETRLTLFLLSILLTLLLLRFSSFVVGLSRLLMSSRVLGSVAFLSLGWMLCIDIGLPSVGRDPLDLLLLWSLGVVGSLLTCMVFPLDYVDSRGPQPVCWSGCHSSTWLSGALIGELVTGGSGGSALCLAPA